MLYPFALLLRPLVLSVVCLFFFVQNGLASGYAVYTQGASALAQGNAVTAKLDDPSAVFYNPALISDLAGTRLQLGSTLIHSAREFDNSTAGADKKVSSNHFPSTLFATHQMSENLTLGLGIFSPFGLGTEWDEKWAGRYISTNSEMTTLNINPVISWQATPMLALAAGVSYLQLDATLEKNLYLSPLPDGHQKFKGDGNGFGYNLGAAIKLTERATLGLNYRSKIDLDIDGQASFSLPVGTPAPVAMMLSNGSGKTSLTLPQQAQIGLAWRVAENFTAQAGLRWEDWSAFQSLVIKLDSGLTAETERNWKDVYAFNLGGKYQLKDDLALMAGYLFDNTPAPDSTFDPSIPSAKAHVFAIGTEYNLNAWQLALAYAWQHYESRTKTNDVGLTVGGPAKGSYQTDSHMLALNLGYRFN